MHGVIDVELAAGKLAKLLSDAIECAVTVDLMNQSRASNCASIDHGVEWAVVVGEADRIESLAAGFNAYRGGDPVFPYHL